MTRHRRFELAQGPAPEAGRGVFETMLVIDSAPLELDAHLSRMRASVQELYRVALPDGASEAIELATDNLALGRVRLDAVPIGDAVALDVTVASVDPGVVNPGWANGTRLTPFTTIVPTGAHKWADRRRLESAEAAAGGSAPLLLAEDGSVLETSRGNVFMVSGDTLVTPPLDGRILPGVTRSIALELAIEAGFATREANIDIDDLLDADELFVTGSVRGIAPVLSCANVHWTSGPMTMRLSTALSKRWPKMVPPSAIPNESPA